MNFGAPQVGVAVEVLEGGHKGHRLALEQPVGERPIKETIRVPPRQLLPRRAPQAQPVCGALRC